MREFLRYIPFEQLKPMELDKSGTGDRVQIPIISMIGIVQGEILECLETNGELLMRQIIQSLHRPTHLVAMSLGALVYNGLVVAMQDDRFITVSLHQKG